MLIQKDLIQMHGKKRKAIALETLQEWEDQGEIILQYIKKEQYSLYQSIEYYLVQNFSVKIIPHVDTTPEQFLNQMRIIELLHHNSTNNSDRDKDDFYTGNTGVIHKPEGFNYPMPVFYCTDKELIKGREGDRTHMARVVKQTVREMKKMLQIPLIVAIEVYETILDLDGGEMQRLVEEEIYGSHLVDNISYKKNERSVKFELSFLFLFNLKNYNLKLPPDGVERLYNVWPRKQMNSALILFYRSLLSTLALAKDQQKTVQYKRLMKPLFKELGLAKDILRAEAAIKRNKSPKGIQRAKTRLRVAKKRAFDLYDEIEQAMVKNRIIVPGSFKEDKNNKGETFYTYTLNRNWFEKPVNLELNINSIKRKKR